MSTFSSSFIALELMMIKVSFVIISSQIDSLSKFRLQFKIIGPREKNEKEGKIGKQNGNKWTTQVTSNERI